MTLGWEGTGFCRVLGLNATAGAQGPQMEALVSGDFLRASEPLPPWLCIDQEAGKREVAEPAGMRLWAQLVPGWREGSVSGRWPVPGLPCCSPGPSGTPHVAPGGSGVGFDCAAVPRRKAGQSVWIICPQLLAWSTLQRGRKLTAGAVWPQGRRGQRAVCPALAPASTLPPPPHQQAGAQGSRSARK